MMLKYLLFIFSVLAWYLPQQGLIETKPTAPYTDVFKIPEDVNTQLQLLNRPLDYNWDVKPILSDKCFACHGPDAAKQKAGLRLDLASAAYSALPETPGKVAIKPGNWAKSEMVHRILSSDPDYKMPTPQSHLALSAQEKAILMKWIQEGAVYKPHWAFVKPDKKSLPTSSSQRNSSEQNPVDAFILEKLNKAGLKPAEEAPKDFLLRRLSLDLTGLPPTIAEIDAFMADKTPEAYAKQVDRLLASPHYGEKIATDWLDVSRFADSHGYTVDRLRDMSPYRDWIIQAFNKNKPYDQFIHEQLAGDLMQGPDGKAPTRDMKIATAFNRLHPQNSEGGIVEEEFQTEYVMDRTNTLGDAFMAISLGCARCHDHKYDPISHKNYFELYSFFNNIREPGQISWNGDLPTPTLFLPDAQQEKVLAFLTQSIAEQETHVKQQEKESIPAAQQWMQAGQHQKLALETIPQTGLQGFYKFDGSLANSLNEKQTGLMKRDAGDPDKDIYVPSERGQALLLNGDGYADLKDVGVFRRSEPFSVGIWAWFPKKFEEGVIFHKGNAERLYNFKGYHLLLKNNKLEISMVHAAPSNAITKQSTIPVPRERWIQLTMTYDGSSRADGFKLFQEGQEIKMETVVDQLTKDILFYEKKEPALQIGGWWRGLGFKGGKVDDVLVYNRTLTPYEVQILAGKNTWSAIANKPYPSLQEKEKKQLEAYYLAAEDNTLQKERKELQIRRTALSDSIKNVPQIMVMQEMPKPKKSYLLLRGQYDLPDVEVFPNTPEAILPFSNQLPKNRLGLAQWLTNSENPLTARVAVNRYWQMLFGVGIVKTTEDFGNQGELPSHPELLDWLAVTFQQDYQWDVKKLLRLMVMSDTYRQDSKTSAHLKEIDSENRLLARGPSNTLSAEMIRDNALAASGLIKKQIGGKSIKPYQPDGLWEINSMTYKADTTDDVYRRSLYVVVKRSVPNPTLATFDAPSRSSCVVRRQRTNTPLQALVTLNDPTFLEAVKVLGAHMAHEKDPEKSIVLAYRSLTGRKPLDKELILLRALYESEFKKFKSNPEKTKGWLDAGMYKLDPTLDQAHVAAHAVVAITILNSDATLTKR